MVHPEMPQAFIVEHTITVTIKKHAFDFLVKATPYGEVFYVESMFLQLPEAAQKMMVSGLLQKEQHTRHRKLQKGHFGDAPKSQFTLKHLKTLLDAYAYMLPFQMLLEYYEVYNYSHLEGLVEKIKLRKMRMGNQEYSWLYRLIPKYWYDRFQALLDDDPRKELQVMGRLLSLEEKPNAPEATFLVRLDTEFTTTIVYNILPALPQRSQGYVYQKMARFPTKQNKQFLLDAFGQAGQHHHLSKIISGLSGFKDIQIRDVVCEYYPRFKANNAEPKVIAQLLEYLKGFKSIDVELIAWRELVSHDIMLGNKAYELLIENDLTEADIVDGLLFLCHDGVFDPAYLNALMRLKLMSEKKLLPSEAELWKVFKEKYSQSTFEIPESKFLLIIDLICSKFSAYSQKQLKEVLSSENNELKRAGLGIISQLGKSDSHLKVNQYLDQEILAQVKALTQYEAERVVASAVKALAVLTLRLREKTD